MEPAESVDAPTAPSPSVSAGALRFRSDALTIVQTPDLTRVLHSELGGRKLGMDADAEADAADRWALSWPDDKSTADRLGDHCAARYRHFRRFIEQHGGVNDVLFGLLLSAESLRDEMRAFEAEKSLLLRLAQTGHFVRQLQRLHSTLDAAATASEGNEPEKLRQWKVMLEQERAERVTRYSALLDGFRAGVQGQQRREDGGAPRKETQLVKEVKGETEQIEVLALLKAEIDKYSKDVLTEEEIETTLKASKLVAQFSGVVVVSLPTWFVPEFEFGGTFGLSRWGNDLYLPRHTDQSRFMSEVAVWSGLNHPHIARFLGACHVGKRSFIAHEKVRTLTEYMEGVTDRMGAWKRLYELALALQYLHERGFACANLDMDTAFCSQIEDKAMLLGVGLLDFRSDACDEVFSALHDNSLGGGHDGDRVFSEREARLIASDVRSLGVLSLNMLYGLTHPTRSAHRQGDDVSASDAAPMFSGLPQCRPDFVAGAEWNVLEQMCGTDAYPTLGILAVVNSLAELAGVSQRNWADVIGVMKLEPRHVHDIRTVVIQELYTSIGDAMTQCEAAMKSDDKLLCRLNVRLADVCDQLQHLSDAQQIDLSTLEEALQHFCSVLVRFFRLLQSGMDSFGSQCWMASKSEQLRRDRATIMKLHIDLDRMAEVHRLQLSNNAHLWRSEWLAEIHRQQDSSQRQSIRGIAQNRDPRPSAMSGSPTSVQDTAEMARGNAVSPLRFTAASKWLIPPDEIVVDTTKSLGEGAFAAVHVGKWFDTRVVVKSVKKEKDKAVDLAQFRREADVWFQLNHINVVKMYGACDIGNPFFVCEYADGGRLDGYLRLNDHSPRLIWYCLLNAALGLQYLHDSGVVHGDLKANNILVGTDSVAKLADFGLSVLTRGANAFRGSGALGAYQWKAPECLPDNDRPGQPATFASDVFSFAMCIVEVVRGSLPWGDRAFNTPQAQRGVLPDRPAEMADTEWELVKGMCQLDPARRLTMDGVVVHLSALVERLESERLWTSMQAPTTAKSYKNHVVSRGGALLSLMALAKSNNEKLANIATQHLATVRVNRRARSEQREVEAIIAMLKHGTDLAKSWAAHALLELSRGSPKTKVSILATGGIAELVMLVRHGNDLQKSCAARTLCVLSFHPKCWEEVGKAGGVSALVALLEGGNPAHREIASFALGQLAWVPGLNVMIAGDGGIPSLAELARSGNDDQKAYAAAALFNLSKRMENQVSIATGGGIGPLVAMVRDGSDFQKVHAVEALYCLFHHPDCRKAVANADGIYAMIELLSSNNPTVRGKACRVLAELAVLPEVSAAIAGCDGMSTLIAFARDGNDAEKLFAAVIMWHLSRHMDNPAVIAAIDCVPPLVTLIRDGSEPQKLNAMRALCSISLSPRCAEHIAAAGGISALIGLLSSDSAAHREMACNALAELAVIPHLGMEIAGGGAILRLVELVPSRSSDRTLGATATLRNLAKQEENCATIVSCGGTAPLVALVNDGNNHQKELAAVTLWRLCMHPKCWKAVVEAGGISALSGLLSGGCSSIRHVACFALTELALNPGLGAATVGCGAVPDLVGLLRDGNETQKALAATALGRLAVNTANIGPIVSAGGISALVALYQDGTDIQKVKAAETLGRLGALESKKALLPAASVDVMRARSSDNDAVPSVRVNGNNELPATPAGVASLLAAFQNGDEEEKKYAAAALWTISIGANTGWLIAALNSIPKLVQLLWDGDNSQKTTAAELLANLSRNIDNRLPILRAGAPLPLVAMAKDGSHEQKESAARVLWMLSQHPHCRKHIVDAGGVLVFIDMVACDDFALRELAGCALADVVMYPEMIIEVPISGDIAPLVALARSGDDTAKLGAAAALLILMKNANNQLSIVNAGGIDPLVALVRQGNDIQKTYAARALWCLSVRPNCWKIVSEAGGISAFISLASSNDAGHREIACSVLGDLATRPETGEAIAGGNGISQLVDLARDGNDAEKVCAAAALWNWSTYAETPIVIVASGGVPPLVAMIRDGNDIQKSFSARVIVCLSLHQSTWRSVVEAGGIAAIIELLSSDNVVHRQLACTTLEQLTRTPELNVSIAGHGGISPLVEMARSGSDDEKTCAASSLLHLSNFAENRVAIVTSGGIAPLVALARGGNDLRKLNAARTLWLLCLDQAHREATVGGGGISAMIELLRSDNSDHRDWASCVLAELAWCPGPDAAITERGGVPALLEMLESGNDIQKASAAGALWGLARARANRSAIATAGIPAFMALIRNGNNIHKERAAAALSALCDDEPAQKLIVSEGGVEALVVLARDGTDEQKRQAVTVLEQLLRRRPSHAQYKANRTLITACDGIPVLVELIRGGNEKLKAHALDAIWSLSQEQASRPVIAAAGGVPVVVGLICDGNDEQNASAAGAHESLSNEHATRPLIAAAGGIRPSIYEEDEWCQKARATQTIRNLCNDASTRGLVVAEGGVPALLSLARDGNDTQKELATGALAALTAARRQSYALQVAAGIAVLAVLLYLRW